MEEEQKPYVELLSITPVVAYQRRTVSREIICAYLAGNNKSRLRTWGEWLCNQHSVGSGFELRQAERLTAFKYEIKLWGMSIEAVERLPETDTTKFPPANYGNAPKRKLAPVAPVPKALQIEDVGVGDIVRSTVMRDWQYRVVGITPDKYLDCERVGVTPSIRAGLHPASVELVSKASELTEEEIAIANESIQPPAPSAAGYLQAPIGRAGAAKNWGIYQAYKAEQRSSQTAVLDAPPAVDQQVTSGDWVELLCNGDRCQVETVDTEGIHLLTDDGNITAQADEVKLLLHIPDSWKPF